MYGHLTFLTVPTALARCCRCRQALWANGVRVRGHQCCGERFVPNLAFRKSCLAFHNPTTRRSSGADSTTVTQQSRMHPLQQVASCVIPGNIRIGAHVEVPPLRTLSDDSSLVLTVIWSDFLRIRDSDCGWRQHRMGLTGKLSDVAFRS